MTRLRKSLGKKLRFEVFKRDKFTCQYCGGKAPDVVLVCDHVTPVASGGENTLLNLVTSCETCNSGKGAVRLDDASALIVQRAELDRLAERREQVEMMLSWHRGLAKETNYELHAFCGRWAEVLTPFYLNEIGMAEAKKRLRSFTLADLLAAMDVAVNQYVQRDDHGKPTAESANKAWAMIPGIARLSKLPADERALYYVRGILRKRLHYCNEREALSLLREALTYGADAEDLKQMAREASNWTDWRRSMHSAYIDAGRTHARP